MVAAGAVAWRGRCGAAARAPCAGGGVLPLAGVPTLESASQQPLAFAIVDPANRLATGGAAETRRPAMRFGERFIASWPVA